jgi:RimJ/RimL family protein N-acetyltransferase
VILRAFAASDTDRLRTFACSTGKPFEDEVEDWIRAAAIGWVNDVPRATYQRRALAVIEDDAGSLVAVAAWQDIIRVDLDGIWLQVLAVSTNHQHGGYGQRAYELVIERLHADDGTVANLAGLVDPDNYRSKRLLTAVGWGHDDDLAGHELWILGR